MQSLLEEFVLSQIIVYILTFARVGTVMMLMPGVADSFVPPTIRLAFAVAMTLVLSPITATYLPDVTTNIMLITLIISEMIIGFFIGIVVRIFMAALDVGGMLISTSIGIGNAMIFGQIISRGQPMPAPANDDHIIFGLWVWFAPRSAPAFVAPQPFGQNL